MWPLLLGECLGTAALVLFGNGAVANEHLRRTKGNGSGYTFIAFGFGFAVMIGLFISLPYSGGTINPAVTIGKAITDQLPWSQVVPLICAQMVGAIIGQLIAVWIYWQYFRVTKDPDRILATFSTSDGLNDKSSYFAAEFVATGVLTFAAFEIERNDIVEGLTPLILGLVVAALVISLGGPSGPGANPARDLGPRMVHAILPIPNKGGSSWRTAWIPVVAPILGAITAAFLFIVLGAPE